MFKLSVIGIIIVLSGCTSTPRQPPIDPQCDTVGKYARSIAVLRDMGIPLMEIDSFSSTPTAVTFPFQRIKREAYWMKTETPADAYDVFYSRCTVVGYNNLLIDMTRMEAARVNALDSLEKRPIKTKKR